MTSGSIEIDMMKKQLSKKKLERLTIQGGDYRKAGRREGRQQVSLDELKMLLEDDVKNLSRMEIMEYSSSSDSSNSSKSIITDISEEELELIMNREKLFKKPNEMKRYNIKVTSSSAIASGLTDLESTDWTDIQKMEEIAVAAPIETNPEVDELDDYCEIPKEGVMYDIITESSLLTQPLASIT